MTIRTDPEGYETDALIELVDLDGAEVLEIGCGDGRLTWRYANRTTRVTAIDPFADGISRAKETLAGSPLPIEFHEVAFAEFAVDKKAEVFDVAILSWSLC